MNTDKPTIVTVPTEMGRQDGFFDLAVLMGAGMTVWWLALRGVPIWAFIPVLIVIAIWTLTGEPAGDVQVIGGIASGLRSKLGMRRAHEWLLAWGHYFLVRQWPDFKEWLSGTRVGRRTAKVYLRARGHRLIARLARRMRPGMREVRRRLRRLPEPA